MCVFPVLRAVSENSPASPRKNSSRETSIPQPRTPLSGRFQPSRSARPGAKRHAVPPCFLVFFGCPTIFSFERPPAEHAFHPCFVVLFDAPSHRALKREAGCEKRPHAGDLQCFTRFRDPPAGVVATPFYSSISPGKIRTLCASGRPGFHEKLTESSAKHMLSCNHDSRLCRGKQALLAASAARGPAESSAYPRRNACSAGGASGGNLAMRIVPYPGEIAYVLHLNPVSRGSGIWEVLGSPLGS